MYKATRDFLKQNEGKVISIKGKISKSIWQHIQALITSHPHINYFELEDGFQILVYSKNQVDCNDILEITGRIIKVEGSKDINSKAYEHTEYHIIADSWKCL